MEILHESRYDRGDGSTHERTTLAARRWANWSHSAMAVWLIVSRCFLPGPAVGRRQPCCRRAASSGFGRAWGAASRLSSQSWPIQAKAMASGLPAARFRPGSSSPGSTPPNFASRLAHSKLADAGCASDRCCPRGQSPCPCCHPFPFLTTARKGGRRACGVWGSWLFQFFDGQAVAAGQAAAGPPGRLQGCHHGVALQGAPGSAAGMHQTSCPARVQAPPDHAGNKLKPIRETAGLRLPLQPGGPASGVTRKTSVGVRKLPPASSQQG